LSDVIKSAWEKALERFEKKAKNLSPEQALRLQFLPEGKRLATRYMYDNENNDNNLSVLLSQYNNDVRGYVQEGIEKAFLDNLTLPQTKEDEQKILRIIQGLQQIKSNRRKLGAVINELQQLLESYRQVRRRAAEQLKSDLTQRYRQALQQQATRGRTAVNQQQLNMEFNMRWQKEQAVLMQKLAERANPTLEQIKLKIKNIK